MSTRTKIHVYPAIVTQVRGPGKRDPRPYWRAVVHVGGDSKTVWCGRATKEEAAAATRDALDERPDGLGDTDSTVRTVLDLMEVWSAARAARPRLKAASIISSDQGSARIAYFIGEIRLASLSRRPAPLMDDFRDEYLAEDRSPRTFKLDLEYLGAAVKWGHARGLLDLAELPWPAFKATRSRKRYTPTRAEVLRIIDTARGRSRDCIAALAMTGCRIGELVGTSDNPAPTHAGIDRERRLLHVVGKTATRADPRDVPMSPALWELLSGRIGVLFKVRRQTVSEELARACERAGVERFTPHGFRRFVITETLRGGRGRTPMAMSEASKIFGVSVSILMRDYFQSTPESRVEAARAAGLGDLW